LAFLPKNLAVVSVRRFINTKANTKYYFLTVVASLTLAGSIAVPGRKAHAQNAASVTADDIISANPIQVNALQGAPIFMTQMPAGYRDWRLKSVAHEEGNLN
jgi:hypothetical protein